MEKGTKFFRDNQDGVLLSEGWQTLVAKDIKLWYAKDDTEKKKVAFIISFLNPETQISHNQFLRTDGSSMANKLWVRFTDIFGLPEFEDGTPDEDVLAILREKMLGEPFDCEIRKTIRGDTTYVNMENFAEAGERSSEATETKPQNHSTVETTAPVKTKW